MKVNYDREVDALYLHLKKGKYHASKELGFEAGNKTYSLKVPEQILNAKDPKIWAAFVRGYFAADGCLNFHKRYGAYCEFK
ncbi:DUF2283 domain-containing protein [archaeon]|nr:DUF2283 domain-containing protein [archaeon]